MQYRNYGIMVLGFAFNYGVNYVFAGVWLRDEANGSRDALNALRNELTGLRDASNALRDEVNRLRDEANGTRNALNCCAEQVFVLGMK